MLPEKIALTLSLGLCFGIVPFFGVNFIILSILALLLRLNIPAIQLINFVVYGFQLALYVPFLKMGQMLFFKNSTDMIINNLTTECYKDFWGTFVSLWHMHLAGLMVWAMISIPFGFFIYYRSLEFFKKKKKKLNISSV